MVCSLGLRDALVGVSHECDFPASVRGLPAVTCSLIGEGLASAVIDEQVGDQLRGGRALYGLDREALAALHPDLIVSQALCDVCAVAAPEVEAAARTLPGAPRVVTLEPGSLEEVFDALIMLGDASGRTAEARRVVAELEDRVDAVRSGSAGIPLASRPRVAVLEWLDPLFNAGHWTPELVELAGGIDCLGNPFAPSSRIDFEALEACDADVIFVALCGFDVGRALVDVARVSERPAWRMLPAVRAGRVYVADGNAYFSRSGPRLVDSLELLAQALHPEVHPGAAGVPSVRCVA